jgi:hypothetical protein
MKTDSQRCDAILSDAETRRNNWHRYTIGHDVGKQETPYLAQVGFHMPLEATLQDDAERRDAQMNLDMP